jgi:hypothetical protein
MHVPAKAALESPCGDPDGYRPEYRALVDIVLNELGSTHRQVRPPKSMSGRGAISPLRGLLGQLWQSAWISIGQFPPRRLP